MSHAENVLLFDVVFTILLVSYGSSIGVVDLNPIATLPAPPDLKTPQMAKCAFEDVVCNVNNGVQAAAYPGYVLLQFLIYIGYFILVIVKFGNTILQTAFSPSLNGGVSAIPFAGAFFIALQAYVLFEVVRIFRGSSSGV